MVSIDTSFTAFLILLLSLIGLEISGVLLIKYATLNSRPKYKILGKIVCWGGLFLLIVGAIGFLVDGG